MYCVHCGGAMEEGARYCAHCGGMRHTPGAGTDVRPTAGDQPYHPHAPAPGDPDLVGVVRPWVRYWARTFDMMFLLLVIAFLLGIVAPKALDDEVFSNLFGFVCTAAWVLIEPLYVVNWGTTPGKWLFRTRIVTVDGRRPTYEDALMRSFRVWWRGLAVGVPLVSLATLIIAHGKLTTNGVTSWDRQGGFDVVHKRLGPGRLVAIACVTMAIIAFIAWAMTLAD